MNLRINFVELYIAQYDNTIDGYIEYVSKDIKGTFMQTILVA